MTHKLDDMPLLPCPFCGGEARSWYGPSNGGGVRCQNTSCQAFMRDFGTEQHAIAAWNRRTDTEHSECTVCGEKIPYEKYIGNRQCKKHLHQ